MLKKVKLFDVVDYSKSRISNSEVSLENFITTDNILQNKKGIKAASKLPPSGNYMPKYDVGDILVSNIRPYLKKIWFANKSGGCSSDVLVFKTKGDYVEKFVYYNLFSDDFFAHMMKGAKGTKMPRGDKNQILQYLIPQIEVVEQKKISTFLSFLDSKIELNNKINKELESLVKTFYDYWFVQFDFPNTKGKPYKVSGGKMTYSEELRKEIPEGWRVGILNDISELVRGVSYGKNDIKESNNTGVIPILRATNIAGNVIDLENMVYVDEANVSEKQLLNKYDILMTMSSGSKDHIGKNGFFYFDDKVAFGTFCAKFVAKDKFQFYLYSYTQSEFMFTTIKNECLGTNINNLNGALVSSFKILIPPINFIEEFNKIVFPVYEKVSSNVKENQKLTEIRDWLLPLLMNRQVKVK